MRRQETSVPPCVSRREFNGPFASLPFLAVSQPHPCPENDRWKQIVENCYVSVYDNGIIKLTVDFKWNNNILKIVLVHFFCFSFSLLLATTAMVASTQSTGMLYRTPFDQSSAEWIGGMQIAVAVCEVIAVGNEVLQMFRQGRQYLMDGGGWNIVDLCGSTARCSGCPLFR